MLHPITPPKYRSHCCIQPTLTQKSNSRRPGFPRAGLRFFKRLEAGRLKQLDAVPLSNRSGNFVNKVTIPYVTTNNGKFQEIATFLAECHNLPFNLTQETLETTEIQSDDQEEITEHKAKEAWNILKKPLLVEDAGIFFEKYTNFPGTFSKWVFKSLGFEGICKLYTPGDRAYFQITLGYITSPESTQFFQTRCYGTLIAPKPGYNPCLPFSVIFVPDGFTQTYQELTDSGKAGTFKFRAKAIDLFVEWFNQR